MEKSLHELSNRSRRHLMRAVILKVANPLYPPPSPSLLHKIYIYIYIYIYIIFILQKIMIQLEREYDACSEFNTLQNMHIEVQMRNDLYNTQRKESTNLTSSTFSIYSHMLYYRHHRLNNQQFLNKTIKLSARNYTMTENQNSLLTSS